MAQITSVKGLGNHLKSLARLLSEQHFLAQKGELSSFLSQHIMTLRPLYPQRALCHRLKQSAPAKPLLRP